MIWNYTVIQKIQSITVFLCPIGEKSLFSEIEFTNSISSYFCIRLTREFIHAIMFQYLGCKGTSAAVNPLICYTVQSKSRS